ncbi:MAG TPA: ParB N-terminal domain-containing protein [Verrucomicrobiae bacterium]|nr:ParB N-terminal domain-containing protein [Verrucomicrobiae bacterium]
MKTEIRDPQDLRIHRLHKAHIPAPDKESAEWLSFVDGVSGAGPQFIPAIVINLNGEIIDGARRWLAAKQLGWNEIRCEIHADGDAAAVMVESLFGQRDLTRGAKVYIALGLLKEFVESAESRRLANLRHGRETLEKPLKLPNFQNGSSEPQSVADLCARWGIKDKIYYQARKVQKIFDDRENEGFKKTWHDKLIFGEASLWNVISAFGGEKTDQSKRDAGVMAKQMELGLEGLVQWNSLPENYQESVIEKWRKTAAQIPKSLRKTIIEILENA